jgi:hypothetical protein
VSREKKGPGTFSSGLHQALQGGAGFGNLRQLGGGVLEVTQEFLIGGERVPAKLLAASFTSICGMLAGNGLEKPTLLWRQS